MTEKDWADEKADELLAGACDVDLKKISAALREAYDRGDARGYSRGANNERNGILAEAYKRTGNGLIAWLEERVKQGQRTMPECVCLATKEAERDRDEWKTRAGRLELLAMDAQDEVHQLTEELAALKKAGQ